MNNSEKVACVHCGAETELYFAGSPICIRCADERQGKGKPQGAVSWAHSGHAPGRGEVERTADSQAR
jgi:hypothetical protein